MTIAVKLFSDDLALALENRFRKKIDVENFGEQPQKKIILDYITGELNVIINKKDTANLVFTKSEENEGAIWLYFKVNYPGRIQEMKIRNSLLVDMFHDQTNLVIISNADQQNGYRFNYYNREQEIQLK